MLKERAYGGGRLRKVYILFDELSRKAANTILENRKFSSMFVFGRYSLS